MEERRCISSDTNIWFDFNAIGKISLPFKLPYTYIMYKEALREEIISPPELLNDLLLNGLLGVSITEKEFFLAEDYAQHYVKLSAYDRIALSVAKTRGIELLSGDGALRKAAESEKDPVLGTIGILDRLYKESFIGKTEYRRCLIKLKEHPERRLPVDEIDKRLASIETPIR